MRVHKGEMLVGAAGTATEVLVDTIDRPDQAATVAVWFLHCSGQSPAWSKFALSVVHLRPIPGGQPPNLQCRGATHEVLLIALDPDHHPVADDLTTWRYLTPLNLAEQVRLSIGDADPDGDDSRARQLLRDCAGWVLDGSLWAEPPLSGQVEPWRSVLRSGAAHLRGEHAQSS